MAISLIICTRDRSGQLKRCLASVAELRFGEADEVVIVDNGSSDDTPDVISNFISNAPFRVRGLVEQERGLARARNRGIGAARGDILAFTDDDCYPAPDFLQQVAKAFEDPAVGYAGGRIRLFDPDDFPITILEVDEARRFAPRSFLESGVIQGANMSFRRQALEAIGLFDVTFGSGAAFPAEDIDAAARASLAGWVGVYEPAIIVAHHHGRRAEHIPALMRAYDVGRGAYHMKLLLRSGRMDWFLGSQIALLRRMPRHPRSALNELRGSFAYLAQLLQRPGKVGASG